MIERTRARSAQRASRALIAVVGAAALGAFAGVMALVMTGKSYEAREEQPWDSLADLENRETIELADISALTKQLLAQEAAREDVTADPSAAPLVDEPVAVVDDPRLEGFEAGTSEQLAEARGRDLLDELIAEINSSEAEAPEEVEAPKVTVAPTEAPKEAPAVEVTTPQAEVVDYAAIIRTDRQKTRVVEAFEAAVKVGGAVEEAAVVAMLERRQQSIDELLERAEPVLKVMEGWREQLAKERKEALDVIRKPGKDKKAHNDKVKSKLDKLKQTWNQRNRRSRRKPALKVPAGWIAALQQALQRHLQSRSPGLGANTVNGLQLSQGTVSLGQSSSNVQELYLKWRNEQVRAYNKQLADGPEKSCLKILNDYREMLGLHLLAHDTRLYAAARGHSHDMVAQSFFSHISPVTGKQTPEDRIKLAGYWKANPTKQQTFYEEGPLPAELAGSTPLQVGGRTGENIAQGTSSAQGVFELWKNSPPHHANMVGDWDTIGIGMSQGTWTQCFGGLNVSTTRR